MLAERMMFLGSIKNALLDSCHYTRPVLHTKMLVV